MSGVFASADSEIPDHVAAHVEVELAVQQQQRPVGLRAAWNDGDVESILGVSAVGRRLKEAARRRIGQPVGAELHLVERQGRPSEAEQSHQGSKHRQSHFDTPRLYGLLRSEGGEIKSRSRRTRFTNAVRPSYCGPHCQACPSSSCKECLHGGGQSVDSTVSPLDIDPAIATASAPQWTEHRRA